MKSIGLVVLIIGLVVTLYTGFNYVTKETIVEVGNIEITADKSHNLSWSPILGIIVMLVGGTMLYLESKKK